MKNNGGTAPSSGAIWDEFSEEKKNKAPYLMHD